MHIQLVNALVFEVIQDLVVDLRGRLNSIRVLLVRRLRRLFLHVFFDKLLNLVSLDRVFFHFLFILVLLILLLEVVLVIVVESIELLLRVRQLPLVLLVNFGVQFVFQSLIGYFLKIHQWIA